MKCTAVKLCCLGLIAGAWSNRVAFAAVTNYPLVEGACLKIHPRMYYMRRHFDEPKTQSALALGGWLDFESGRWHGFSVGLAPYTSQRLYGPDSEAGSRLLKSDQAGYTVLGQAWAQYERWDSRLRLYRQILDTPFLNPYDYRMTPVTVEAYTFESAALTNFLFMLSQVERIKGWNDSSFCYLSDAAGYAGTDDGLTLAGAVWRPAEGIVAQAWEYYAHNLANTIYGQADGIWPVGGALVLSASAQGVYQRDVGAAYAGEFQTGMGGVQGGASWRGWTMTAAGTITDGGADIFNPWASYPGFTSLVEEDNNVAGAKAWMVELRYDLAEMGLRGWSAFVDHSQAWTPDQGSLRAPAQLETDVTVDYRPGGWWTGFWLRLRAGFVENSLTGDGVDYEDYRIMVNYERRLF